MPKDQKEPETPECQDGWIDSGEIKQAVGIICDALELANIPKPTALVAMWALSREIEKSHGLQLRVENLPPPFPPTEKRLMN